LNTRKNFIANVNIKNSSFQFNKLTLDLSAKVIPVDNLSFNNTCKNNVMIKIVIKRFCWL